jgi:abortive infection bacteriophage resistance protein
MMSRSFSEKDIGVKAPATITAQLEILKERGLLIGDERQARLDLETINYYRLVHYFAVFLEDSGQYYKSGTRFEDGMKLYNFDRKLRAEILVVLEEIEIAARAAISNYHTVKYGILGYLNADTFDRRHNHKVFLNKIERMLDKNADLSFVRHYNKKHKGAFPLWVMMEMFSFGMLVIFYQDLEKNDKKDIALHYFKQDPRNVENWLENLAALRNHCAHYNRIYDNPLPGELRAAEMPGEYKMGSSLFDYLLVIKLLHKRGNEYEGWAESFADILEGLFNSYADLVNPRVLGFPEDWKKFLI